MPDITPDWWACEHPERPDDEHCIYHGQCIPCMLALMASVSHDGPDLRVYARGESEAGEPPELVRALDVIANELADLGVVLPRAARVMFDL